MSLACRPPELLEVWPIGTVPLLQLHGVGAPMGESLEIMRWALARRDPQGLLELGGDDAGSGVARADADPLPAPSAVTAPMAQADGALNNGGAHGSQSSDLGVGLASAPLPEPIAALIAENDGPFKHHLDRFKYATRYPGEDSGRHRQAGLAILRGWEARLQGGWLLGPRPSLADMALLPFVRQFRLADPEAFDADPALPALRAWLRRFEVSEALAAVMAPPWAPRQPWRSPRWIYHLALAEEWRQAREQGEYRRSTRGLSLEQVGFIHATHPHQIAATHGRFYGDAGPVQLLTIDPARLAELGIEVLEEEAAEGTGERFPHIHGPLPTSAVLAAEPYRP